MTDPRSKPCSATVMALSGREVALQKDNGILLRRNRCMVTRNYSSVNDRRDSIESPNDDRIDTHDDAGVPQYMPAELRIPPEQEGDAAASTPSDAIASGWSSERQSTNALSSTTDTSSHVTVSQRRSYKSSKKPSVGKPSVPSAVVSTSDNPTLHRQTRSGREVKPVTRLNL